MTDPTLEAYEAAAETYDRAVIVLRHRAGHHDAVRAVVDAVWPIAERDVRAKVAAEIRAACDCATDPGQAATCEFAAAARIAEGSTE